MKALFIGGVKSGKSKNAEAFTISHAGNKPYYLATTEFIDEEMAKKIELHKEQRSDNFITIEESLQLSKNIATCDDIVLVECISIWLNNMLYHKHSREEIFDEIDTLLGSDRSIVFVLNDVGSGIIPDNALAREFVELSGIIAQKIAAKCDAVYHTIAGISTKIK